MLTATHGRPQTCPEHMCSMCAMTPCSPFTGEGGWVACRGFGSVMRGWRVTWCSSSQARSRRREPPLGWRPRRDTQASGGGPSALVRQRPCALALVAGSRAAPLPKAQCRGHREHGSGHAPCAMPPAPRPDAHGQGWSSRPHYCLWWPVVGLVPVGWEGPSARVGTVQGGLWAVRSTRDHGRPRWWWWWRPGGLMVCRRSGFMSRP